MIAGAQTFAERQRIADALLRLVSKVRRGESVESVLLEFTREPIQLPPKPGDVYWRYRPGPLETWTLTVRHRT